MGVAASAAEGTLEGSYEEDTGLRLKADGLWDAEVMATIEVTFDVPGTTPVPRPPKYKLLAAEPLTPPATTEPMF